MSVAGVVARLWHEPYSKRIDFHIYFGTVRRWPARSLYAFDASHHLGSTYPPFASVLLWPVTRLPEAFAEHAWLIATVAASAAFLAITCRLLPERPRGSWFAPVVVAVGLWSVPVLFTARIGQINAFLALAVVADVALARRGSKAAGIASGVAAAVKLTPIAAVLYFVAARRWRAAVTAVVSFVACGLAAALVSPRDSARYWGGQLFAVDRVGRVASKDNDAVRRLVADTSLHHSAQTLVWIVIVLVLFVVAFVRARRAADVGNDLAAITIAMCFVAAASPISWAHHLYFLLPVVPLLIGSGSHRSRLVLAAVMMWMLFEISSPGYHARTNVARAWALPLVVVALPIDRKLAGWPDARPPPGSDPSAVSAGAGHLSRGRGGRSLLSGR
jgi:hypothetical protein